MGFHHDVLTSLLHNHHMLSFLLGSVNGSAMASGGMGNPGDIVGTNGIYLPGSSNMITNMSRMVQAGPSSSNLHIDPIASRKQDTGLSPEWTVEEQNILSEGLARYAAERGIMKYIKIASSLRRKTVRDVALRCRWLAKPDKRRKLEEQYAGKKGKDRKEKMVESCSNVPIVPSENIAPYSSMLHQVNCSGRFPCEVPALDSATQQLVEENAQILNQITANLATFKIQDNIELFYRTRNNITTILNNMSNMPGIMSQMPALPVSVNEELLHAMLSSPSQTLMFGAPNMHLEQQLRHDDLL